MKKEIDLRTTAERERDNRHRAIVADYLQIAGQYPSAAPSRIIGKVAELYGMTSMGIRKILERNSII